MKLSIELMRRVFVESNHADHASQRQERNSSLMKVPARLTTLHTTNVVIAVESDNHRAAHSGLGNQMAVMYFDRIKTTVRGDWQTTARIENVTPLTFRHNLVVFMNQTQVHLPVVHLAQVPLRRHQTIRYLLHEQLRQEGLTDRSEHAACSW